ncbi:MAG: EAL domain-containing protein [Nitratireductor sp.]
MGLAIGVFALLLGVQLIFDTYNVFTSAKEDAVENTTSISRVLARSFEKRLNNISQAEAQELLQSVQSNSQVMTVSIVDMNGDARFGNDLMIAGGPVKHKSVALYRSLESGRTETSTSNEVIEISQALYKNGRQVGALVVGFSNPNFYTIFFEKLQGRMLVFLPLLFATLMIVNKLSNEITNPIRVMTKKAGEITRGNLDCSISSAGPLEMVQFAESFNRMVRTMRANSSQINDLAYIDKVTRIPNREYFKLEVEKTLKNEELQGKPGAILFMDLDGFKRVNDTFGHEFGDRLLKSFAERIRQDIRVEGKFVSSDAITGVEKNKLARVSDVFARLGGDEFTILLSEMKCEQNAEQVANRIIQAVKKPFVIDEKEITIGVSIGISTFFRTDESYDDILKRADMAMYLAKEEGKNTVRVYNHDLYIRAQKRMEVETELRQALSSDQIELHYQPKVDVVKGISNSCEALLRWRHPVKGMISPSEFIPIAEETGMIFALGEFALETACEKIKKYEDEGVELSIAVNVSIQQFERPDFAKIVNRILSKTGANPAKLELEITESMAMNNYDMAMVHINKLKKLGIQLAIDDFGTGYSNLAQLSRLPFDVFKIDHSFVESLAEEKEQNANVIVKTITAMARNLNYKVIAEGVETATQRDILLEAGCEIMQGYYFAKPMPSDELVTWLVDEKLIQMRSLTQQAAQSNDAQLDDVA